MGEASLYICDFKCDFVGKYVFVLEININGIMYPCV